MGFLIDQKAISAAAFKASLHYSTASATQVLLFSLLHKSNLPVRFSYSLFSPTSDLFTVN